MDKPNALVIGGTSGLGKELGLLLGDTHKVFVVGRRDPEHKMLGFMPLDLNLNNHLSENLDKMVDALPKIDLLVYAAGFYQEGKLDELSDAAILMMNSVGLLAPTFLIQRILKKQKTLPGFIAITSTSQWTPRLLEPVYTAVKAGLGMLAQSLSLDPKIGKVLVVGPAGMATPFWKEGSRNMDNMLSPEWVAQEIVKLYNDSFKYKFSRILREPPRVEVVEKRV